MAAHAHHSLLQPYQLWCVHLFNGQDSHMLIEQCVNYCQSQWLYAFHYSDAPMEAVPDSGDADGDGDDKHIYVSACHQRRLLG